MPRLFIVLALLLPLIACVPAKQGVAPAVAPARFAPTHLVAPDGARLPLRRWLPDGRVRATLLALHGFNDYANAFTLAAEQLTRSGIAVYAYDQRGFGNAAQRGIWGNRDNLVRDVQTASAALKAAYPAAPHFLLGESMGGAVLMTACAQGGCPDANGLVLVAPAVWGADSMGWFASATLWLTAHTLPAMELTGEGLNVQASDNIPMLQQLSADPLIIKSTRVDAIYGLVGLMSEAYDSAPDQTAPILLLYGKNDQVIPPEPVGEVATRIRSPLVAAHYPAGWHMLLRDLGRALVLDDITSWIHTPARPLPSGLTVKVEHTPPSER